VSAKCYIALWVSSARAHQSVCAGREGYPGRPRSHPYPSNSLPPSLLNFIVVGIGFRTERKKGGDRRRQVNCYGGLSGDLGSLGAWGFFTFETKTTGHFLT
jgi:hypothetical protein